MFISVKTYRPHTAICIIQNRQTHLTQQFVQFDKERQTIHSKFTVQYIQRNHTQQFVHFRTDRKTATRSFVKFITDKHTIQRNVNISVQTDRILLEI